jgi:hypothetical protein
LLGLLGLLEFVEFIELIRTKDGGLRILQFIELISLFTWIELIDCRKMSIRFSGFLFQKFVECPIGNTFRVTGVAILSCAIAYLSIPVLFDLVEFTV